MTEQIREAEKYFRYIKGIGVAPRMCEFILAYGGIDGAHHKQWVLDQLLRQLSGKHYQTLIKYNEQLGYEWDEGIAP